MPKDDERSRDEFTGEAEELLDTLSRDLTDFEAQGASVRPELVNKIFREVHTLKGLAGMFGISEISEIAHTLENMLDRLRMGRLEISKELVDLLYDSIDTLNRLVISVRDPSAAALVDLPALSQRIDRIVSAPAQQRAGGVLDELTLDEQTRKSLTEYEEHRLVENVRAGKHILAAEATFDFADFDQKLRALAAKLSESGEVISTLPAVDASGQGIGFRLLYGTTLDQAAVAAFVPEARVSSLRQAAIGEPRPATEEDLSLRSASPTVRVDIAKLDHVMNIVGELLIAKSQLEGLTRVVATQPVRLTTQELTRITRTVGRKLEELQKSVIDTRMVPVGQIYNKLGRTVRKIARELKKDVELILRGEETELDKMMVEELSDPLLHIIRNAIDHGIEPAGEREAAGKARAGKITVAAYQQGNAVVMDISDDGRGIDPDRIRQAAIERGLIPGSESIDSKRAFDLLFAPGFSTAAAVSEISGRGVGLDVVKKNIQELKGSIEVISTPGRGTTFRVMLPITLAIIQALIVRAANQQFAIPLTAVDESLRIYAREIQTVERREVFALRSVTLPLLRLADAFHLDGDGKQSDDRKWFVVVTRSGEKVAGILVDALVRQQEIVIKSIGDRLKSIPGIAGATEIGEGEMVLVLDTGTLIDQFGGSAREMRVADGDRRPATGDRTHV